MYKGKTWDQELPTDAQVGLRLRDAIYQTACLSVC